MSTQNLFSTWPPAPRSAHLEGVGGSGMRALAEFLSDLGWSLTGRDGGEDRLDGWAEQNGIAILKRGEQWDTGQHWNRVGQPNSAIAIHSAAIESFGAAAIDRSLRSGNVGRTFSYPEALGEIAAATETVAVAGTHGKTTTSVLLSLALGGISRLAGGVAQHDGRSGYFCPKTAQPVVIEACEYRSHFLSLRPAAACILNVEWDHPDAFGSLAEVERAFCKFASDCMPTGRLVVEASLIDRLGLDPTTVRFSEKPGDGYSADRVRWNDNACCFVLFRDTVELGEVVVPHLPRSQSMNAVAAMAVALEQGRRFDDACCGLQNYGGIERRFAVSTNGQTTFVDDYAHHPTAVRQTIAEIRSRWPDRPIVSIFEPHQAGRLSAFEREFASALRLSDEVVIAPVFSARESEADSTATEGLAGRLGDLASVCHNMEQVAEWLEARLTMNPQIVVALLGAGKIGRILDERLKDTRHSRGVRGHCPQ